MFIALLILALVFDFLNGFHDSSNVVATVITSRALHPRLALLLAAVSHFVGPFIFGVAVATTVGKDLLDPRTLQLNVVSAALISAVIWNLVTWYLGIPSSSSHALVGGLLGSAILVGGLPAIQLGGLFKVLAALILSPPVGLLAGYGFMRLTIWMVQGASPRVNHMFRWLQIPTLIGLSLSHGTNDAQKTMGVIALGLLLTGATDEFQIPLWVVAVSAGAIALGTSIGGWRLIRTLGAKIYRVRPVHGFASQVAGAGVILGAALVGGPVSTTQVMSSSIMGVGAAERLNMVRWQVLREMGTAWLLTIPVTALISAVAYLLLSQLPS